MRDGIDIGGPAFPASDDIEFQGMALLDYFAGKALAAYLNHAFSRGDESDSEGFDDTDDIATWSYIMAASMLKARKLKGL